MKTLYFPAELYQHTSKEVKDIIQFTSALHLERLIISAIQTIELAVECDVPNIQQIAKNAYENYWNALSLVKFIFYAGIDPYPGKQWNVNQKTMQGHFHVRYDHMIRMLNPQTIAKLNSKGIQL
jgi:hypothetical protein